MKRTATGILALSAIACFGVAACGGGTGTGASRRPTDAVAAPTLTPTPSTKPVLQTKTHADSLSGMGATRDAWDGNHEKASGYIDGAAYGPFVGPQLVKYAGVTEYDGRIHSYGINFGDGTTLADAKALVILEFPSGARFEQVQRFTGCTMYLIDSKPVASALDDLPMVAFDTFGDEPYALRTTVPSRADFAESTC